MTNKNYDVTVIEKILYSFETNFSDEYDLEDQVIDYMTNLFEGWDSGIQIDLDISIKEAKDYDS